MMNTSQVAEISVVIPCYNAQEHISRCLESLLNQSYPAHEIIAVNDASKDATSSIARQFKVTLIDRISNGGAGAARADGARKASGNIVAFLDADCIAPPDWLRRVADTFAAQPELGGLGGRYAHLPALSVMDHLNNFEEEYAHHIFSLHPEDAILPGGNCAFRKDVWDAGRSGRELLYFSGMGSGEDSVVVNELKQLKQSKYFYDLAVHHHARETRGYFKRHFNRGLSRSTIIMNRLTDRAESGMAFMAYGGRSLFAASLSLGMALLSVLALPLHPGLALGASAFFLLLHFILSLPFFRFVEAFNQKLSPENRAGLGARLSIRPLLLLRSLCWIAGGLTGLRRTLAFKLRRNWNVACSILHFWRPGRISKLFYFVTARCNARCSYCFNLENVVNWKDRKPFELTLEEVIRIAKNFGRLPYLTLSGGEPFMRSDLADVVHAFHKHAKTQWVTIPSNGGLTEQTVRAVTEILQKCPGLFLTVQVSIDSMHEEHDRSRKTPGGFARLTETLKSIAKLRLHYRNLRIQIATCFDDFNLHRMDEIVAYCRAEFEYDQQMFYLIRDTHALITDRSGHLIDPYMAYVRSNNDHEWRNHRKTLWSRAARALQGLVYEDIIRIITKKEFLRPCHATQKFVTLYDDGKVSPCEILEKTGLGNIRDFDYDFYKLKRAQQVDRFHKSEIVDKKCNCDWTCATPINILYDIKTYVRLASHVIRPGRMGGS